MKFVKQFGRPLCIMMAVSSLFFFEACTIDPCEDVVCQNSGTCIEGDCECTEGFTGTECEFTYAENIVGDYTVLNSCNTGDPYATTVLIDPDYPSQNNRVRITNPRGLGENFFYPATITSATELNIPSFSIQGTGITGSGTGEILADGSIVLTVDYDGSQCVETLTPN